VVAEVIGNPLMGCWTSPPGGALPFGRRRHVIDNTFATPFMLRPWSWGGPGRREPEQAALRACGRAGGALAIRAGHPRPTCSRPFRFLGAVMAPFDAFLSLRGLRTAGLRAERGAAGAAASPSWRPPHGGGRRPLPRFAQPEEEALAARLLPRGRGSMLALDLGGRDQADLLLRALPSPARTVTRRRGHHGQPSRAQLAPGLSRPSAGPSHR